MVRERLRDERGARSAPSQIEARRRIGDAASAERRSRATTVSPARLVKLTKKRRLVAESGGNASPKALLAPRHDRRRQIDEVGRRHRAATDDANAAVLLRDEHAAIVGSCTNASGSVKPCA